MGVTRKVCVCVCACVCVCVCARARAHNLRAFCPGDSDCWERKGGTVMAEARNSQRGWEAVRKGVMGVRLQKELHLMRQTPETDVHAAPLAAMGHVAHP